MPILPTEWQTEGVKALAVLVVGSILLALIYKTTSSWWLVSATCGVLVLLIVASHPDVLRFIVQLRRDRYAYMIQVREVNARYLVDRHNAEAKQAVSLAEIEHQGQLRERHQRHFELTADGQQSSEPIEDPLRAFTAQLLIDAYKPSNQEPDGKLINGPTRKRIMESGYTRTQAEAIGQQFIDAGVMRFERGAWFLNRDRFPDAKAAYRAVFGEEW